MVEEPTGGRLRDRLVMTYRMREPADELLAVDDVRMFVPSKDFDQSKSFYSALGWTTVWTDDDGLAILELGDHRFMLQDFYVREWAENFMMTVVVRSAQAWFDHVTGVLAPATSATRESPNRRWRTGVPRSPTSGIRAAS